jgi:hypothetical protein
LKRQRKVRLTYVERPQEQIDQALQMAVFQGGVLWDYFSSILSEDVEGATEFERGMAEGARRLSRTILTIAMNKTIKVQTNEET